MERVGGGGGSGDVDALGFFGYAYYVENRERLRAVPIDGGKGPVAPSLETINNGDYAPLSRPIFIYVSQTGIAKPQVRAFVEFYLEQSPHLSQEVGYVPLPAAAYEQVRQSLADWKPAPGTTGS